MNSVMYIQMGYCTYNLVSHSGGSHRKWEEDIAVGLKFYFSFEEKKINID